MVYGQLNLWHGTHIESLISVKPLVSNLYDTIPNSAERWTTWYLVITNENPKTINCYAIQTCINLIFELRVLPITVNIFRVTGTDHFAEWSPFHKM